MENIFPAPLRQILVSWGDKTAEKKLFKNLWIITESVLK